MNVSMRHATQLPLQFQARQAEQPNVRFGLPHIDRVSFGGPPDEADGPNKPGDGDTCC